MALIRWKPTADMWDPFGSLEDIREEMNRALDTSLRRRSGLFDGAFSPAIDVVGEQDNFLVKVDLPGLSKDDVSVTVQDNFLTIKGERKHEIEKKEGNYYHRERVHGQFVRTIELPARIDAGKALATFKDGVLHVTLPKSEEARPKEIKVNIS